MKVGDSPYNLSWTSSPYALSLPSVGCIKFSTIVAFWRLLARTCLDVKSVDVFDKKFSFKFCVGTTKKRIKLLCIHRLIILN